MYQSADLPITSINSLISTIKTDKQVRRWFLYLISQPGFKAEISEGREAGALYKKFRSVLYQERAIFFFLLGALLFIVIARQFQYSLSLVVFFVISILSQIRKKEYQLKICAFLVNRDFNEASFAQKTLYQIGEWYSRKYQVVSLVHAITSVDVVTRKAVFYTIIFATFIYPLNFWQICGSVLAAYYIFYGLVSSAFVYKRTI